MILAAGLSPAWQQIVELDTFRLGEVNRARAVHWCASGKVLNVARALRALAGDDAARNTRTLALIGGTAGDAIRAEFIAESIDARWIDSIAATRVCTTLLDSQTATTTELVENARFIPPEDLSRFRAAYFEESATAEFVVLTGSLPAGVPSRFYVELVSRTPGRVIVDCQGDSLLATLEARPFVVKPNREELGRTLGRALVEDAQLHDAMRELNRRGAEWVVVSQGKGRVWLSSKTRLAAIDPPAMSVVNPIGSGDCLAAGIATGLAAGYDLPDAARLGVAAAAENVRHLLPARIERRNVIDIASRLSVDDRSSL
jgi:tagatose 6-phosphate kinase